VIIVGFGSIILGFIFGCWFGFIIAATITAGGNNRR